MNKEVSEDLLQASPDQVKSPSVRCHYCDAELNPKMHSQISRGYCGRGACVTAAKEAIETSKRKDVNAA